jgi:hypothetical protein
VIDLDEARVERTRFPAPYRYGGTRPAVPSRNGNRELVGLVDRYRDATAAAYAASDRGSVAPILDRYGRSGRSGNATNDRTTLSTRGSSARALNAERYARGPELRRTAAGVGARPALERSVAPSRAAVLRAGGTAARRAALSSTSQGRAQALTKLAARDPQAAKRVSAAGNALARSTALGLAAGVSVTSGAAAGGLVRGGFRPPADSKGLTGCYWGYGYYPWWGGGYGSGWSFGFGWGSGWCSWSPSWCWGPLWASCWYPYYYYSYNYCYPYYCRPYYYYPFYYSTVVHHVYETESSDPVVIVVQNDDAVAADEPVGEAAAAERPVDSPLKLSLSIAAERYLTLGDRAFRDGRYSDAAQFYAKAVEYSPNEGVLHLVLADALFATADYHYAAYSLRRALELDPALAGAVVDKHEFYADPADFDRHLAAAETFVANNPTDSDARLILAANFLFGNRPAAAVDLLESQSALSLRADTAATVILKTAREIQYGEPAKAETPP